MSVAEFVGRPEDYFDFVADLDILITHLAPVTEQTMARVPWLRLIAVSRGGPVNIEIKAARRRGIPVTNTPGRNASAVAEFTLAALLAETRNLIHAGPELCELTFGIVGFGDIGPRVARLLALFGCRILAYALHVRLLESLAPLWRDISALQAEAERLDNPQGNTR